VDLRKRKRRQVLAVALQNKRPPKRPVAGKRKF
jgi:hypothetical protein